MKRQITPTASKSYIAAPVAVQRAFDKQSALLEENLRHPSLRAKKYDETRNLWQARINRNWRFYFLIQGDTCLITDIVPHPKKWKTDLFWRLRLLLSSQGIPQSLQQPSLVLSNILR